MFMNVLLILMSWMYWVVYVLFFVIIVVFGINQVCFQGVQLEEGLVVIVGSDEIFMEEFFECVVLQFDQVEMQCFVCIFGVKKNCYVVFENNFEVLVCEWFLIQVVVVVGVVKEDWFVVEKECQIVVVIDVEIDVFYELCVVQLCQLKEQFVFCICEYFVVEKMYVILCDNNDVNVVFEFY